MAPVAAGFSLPVLTTEGTGVLVVSMFAGVDLIESRVDVLDFEPMLVRLLLGSEEGDSDERFEGEGDGVRFRSGSMDVAISRSLWTVRPAKLV